MPTVTSPAVDLFTASVSRHIDAPPADVFDAWADPDRFAKWFEAHRSIFRKAAVDELWFWEAEHLNKIWPHYCRYVRVERPRLLEFTWMSEGTRGLESRVTLELTAAKGGTDFVLTHSGIPDDEMGRGHQQGWTEIVEALAKKIKELR